MINRILKNSFNYNGPSLEELLFVKDNLPKGKENESVRRIIFDKINALINRGAKKDEKGIRCSDGRMAYLDDLETAIKIVAEWSSSKGSSAELFIVFWDKNEELQYGHQE